MRIGLTGKLIATFGLITLVVVLGSAALNQWTFERDFERYIEARDLEQMTQIAPVLAEEWSIDGWAELGNSRRAWLRFLRFNTLPAHRGRFPDRPVEGERNEPRPRRDADGPPLGRRLLLTNASGEYVAGTRRALDSPLAVAIRSADEVVGWLRIEPASARSAPRDAQFAADRARSTALITALAIALAALAAFLVARNLRRPIDELTEGAEAMASGDFDSRIDSSRTDELGELAERFNSLAASLASNRKARRQWVSDIAHELRTPLTVLRGELQALQDGIRQPTPGAVDSLSEEAERLARLVDDLALLAASDEGSLDYRFEDVDLSMLVEGKRAGWEDQCERAGHRLQILVPDKGLVLQADRQRLTQLLDNLIANSVRYSESPGELALTVTPGEAEIEVCLDDSPPGVPSEARERIFERLVQLDESRSSNRPDSGSGLGLSICQSIADAHNGTIKASESPLGGLRITLQLPRHSE